MTHKYIIDECLPKYSQLVVFCESLSYRYSPSNSEIGILALRYKYEIATQHNQQLDMQALVYNRAINYRIYKFAGVIAFIHRWSLELLVSKVNSSLKFEIKKYCDMVRGVKVLKRAHLVFPSAQIPLCLSPKKNHTNVIQYLNAILELARSISDYKPSDADLELTQVESYIRDLEGADRSVYDAFTLVDRSRKNLFNLVYQEGGLLCTEQACIDYLSSILDSDHYFLSVYRSTSSKLKT